MLRTRGRTLLFALLLTTLAGGIARPIPPRTVLVVKSRDLAPYNQAVEGLKRTLTAHHARVQLREVDLPTDPAGEEAFFASLEQSGPDLVVTVGTQATLSVTRRMKSEPVVFSLVMFSGDSESLFKNRPPNVTGAAMDIPVGLQFQRLREIIPNLARVGVMFNPENSLSEIEQARQAAGEAGLQLVE